MAVHALIMPAKMSAEEKAYYLTLPKNEKTKYTMLLKSRQAQDRGRKNPYGPQSPKVSPAKVVQPVVGPAVLPARKVPVQQQPQSITSAQQSRMQSLMEEFDIEPVKELMKMIKRRGKGGLVAKDRAQMLKFLVPYTTPQLKAIDIQQETKMTVSVNITSFRGASQEMLQAESVQMDESEYADFDESEEDSTLLSEPTHPEHE